MDNSMYQENAMVSYAGDNIEIQNCMIRPYDWYRDYYYYHSYAYPVYIDQRSKIEQAFKIVSILMRKDIIGKIEVKRFIELVDEIAKEL